MGVTSYDDYPYNFSAWAAAGNITIDGGYGTPNMEAIASLNPSLILTDNINDGVALSSMRALGYKVVVLNPTNHRRYLPRYILSRQTQQALKLRQRQ